MAEGTKKYRRPDGSTYMQYGGPKSAQDVEVKEGAPAASPSPSPTPGARSTTSSGGRVGSSHATQQEVADKDRADRAQRAAETAEDTEKLAPWMLEKHEQVEGGLGGAAARARQKASNVSSTAAGDALAADSEAKKKKKAQEKE